MAEKKGEKEEPVLLKLKYDALHDHSIDDLLKEYKFMAGHSVSRKIQQEALQYKEKIKGSFEKEYFSQLVKEKKLKEGEHYIPGETFKEREQYAKGLLKHLLKKHYESQGRKNTAAALDEDDEHIEALVNQILKNVGLEGKVNYEALIQELIKHDGTLDELSENEKTAYSSFLTALAHHGSDYFSKKKALTSHLHHRIAYDDKEREKAYELIEKELQSKVEGEFKKSITLKKELDPAHALGLYAEIQSKRYTVDNLEELSPYVRGIPEDLKNKYRNDDLEKTIKKNYGTEYHMKSK